MKFYKKLLFCSQLIFSSCEKYKVISNTELLIKNQWNRKEILQGELKMKGNYEKVSLVVDVHYGDDVQYQNIFLHVTLKDAEGNVVFEKPDLMFMLFDPATGYPLGRKIFRKQHLEFLVEENLKLKKGIYKIEIIQMTRAERLYGIKKIETKLCVV